MLQVIDAFPVARPLMLRVFFLLTFVTYFSCASTTNAATQEKKDNYAISLQGRTYTPTAGIDTQTAQRLSKIIIQEKQAPHILLQFKHTPTRSERLALQARGVKLLAHVGGNAWHASLTDSTPLSFIKPITRTKYPVLNTIRWIGQLEPEDKIHPVLRESGPGPWATNADGTIKVSVDFYTDVPRERAREILRGHGAVIESERTRRISFYVVVEPEAIDALAAEDGIESIDLYPPPRIESNDGSRAWTNTNAVHAEIAESDPAINIEGNGVILGMWDGNEADDAHHDLTGRVVYGEAPRTGVTSEHSTHVACTIAGNGTVTPAR